MINTFCEIRCLPQSTLVGLRLIQTPSPILTQVNRGSTFALRCSTLDFCLGGQRLQREPRPPRYERGGPGNYVKLSLRAYRKRIAMSKLSGNDVYCTNALLLPIKIMLCSKLLCQKGFKWKNFPYKCGHHTRASPPPPSTEAPRLQENAPP